MLENNRIARTGALSALLFAATVPVMAAGQISTGAIETAVRNIADTRIPATVQAYAPKPAEVGTFKFYNPKTGHTVGVGGRWWGRTSGCSTAATSGAV